MFRRRFRSGMSGSPKVQDSKSVRCSRGGFAETRDAHTHTSVRPEDDTPRKSKQTAAVHFRGPSFLSITRTSTLLTPVLKPFRASVRPGVSCCRRCIHCCCCFRHTACTHEAPRRSRGPSPLPLPPVKKTATKNSASGQGGLRRRLHHPGLARSAAAAAAAGRRPRRNNLHRRLRGSPGL